MPICLILYHLGTPYIASLAQPHPKKSLHQSLMAVVPSWSMNLLLSLTVLASPLNLLNASDILTVYNIYRPPDSSAYSSKQSVFIDEFGSLLSLAAHLSLLFPMNSCSSVTSIFMLTLP